MYKRLKIKKQIIITLVLLVGFFSCSTQQEIQSGDMSKVSKSDNSTTDNSVTEKYWKLVQLYGKKVVLSEQRKKEAHFILKVKDNRVIGNGGCNSFTGAYELLGVNRIKFSMLASTKMACLNASDMEIESEFMKVLGMADSYNVNVDTLQLYRARMAPLAKFEAVYFK